MIKPILSERKAVLGERFEKPKHFNLKDYMKNGMGADAEVIEPEDLKISVIEEINKIKTLYK